MRAGAQRGHPGGGSGPAGWGAGAAGRLATWARGRLKAVDKPATWAEEWLEAPDGPAELAAAYLVLALAVIYLTGHLVAFVLRW
ncbi:hypothetical protein [Desulfovirgula thermocuniculi]|uniref:hypothetical protein n=1 Tax=Desulfovirgula thermocuniculi TaxID=348842 RepID=UPI000405DAB8|nr:hypothetical protein [Desulfovirgula thermocuniculi]